MSKKATAPANLPANLEQVQSEIQVALKQRYEALAAFTDGLPWSKRRYIERLKSNLQQHVLSAIEAGKTMIVLKEMVPHGEFEEIIQEVGFDERTARRYMKIALIFSGFDPETAQQLGVTKLYKMIAAPAQEIANMQEDGKFLGMGKDELIAISAKELEQRVKEAVAKTRLDLEHEKVKAEALFVEKQQLEKDKERLQQELVQAKLGAPPENPLPPWFNEYNRATESLLAFATKLVSDAPDLDDEMQARFAETAWQRIEHEMNHIRRMLLKTAVDPVAHAQATREKMAVLSRDPRFDFEKLDE